MKRSAVLNRRVYFLISVMGLWGTVIGARLYFLHVVDSAFLRDKAQRQQQHVLDISPQRGVIYDRNGHELAVSIKVDSVYAVPDEIKDPARTARILAGLTGVSSAELMQRLDTEKDFVWIKRKITGGESKAILQARLPGIHFQQENERFYPKKGLAAHVLGAVNMDEQGMAGLEYRYDKQVRGSNGRVVVMTDARGHTYNSVETPSAPGANLVTTIDESIQLFAEKEVREAEERTHALGITAIVMDPKSGEILAMANYPTFDPNDYSKSQPESRVNRAVNQVYEPGSTFKVLTVGAALQENLTTPTEMIDCLMGSILVSGHRIHDSKPHGLLSVSDVIKESSDVGAIKLGQRLGDDRFYGYVQRLGFGRPTGIDLPGEEHGLTKPTSRWSGMTLASMSMGQEIGVTPLQILSMVAAVGNGGILYRPYVVKRIQDGPVGFIDTDSHGERVWSEQTTAKLRPMLEDVLTEGGTARAGKLEGYTAAGKTGTAQKIENGHYSKTHFWGSFAGFAPATNPALAIIVVVDQAVGLHQGGQVAAPVFKRIAEQALHYMSVPPDVPLYAPQYAVKEDKKRAEPVPVPLLPPANSSTHSTAVGAWRVVDAAYNGQRSGAISPEPGAIAIPDFLGKSLRQVTEQCLQLGLRVVSSGSGAAVQQSIPAGTGVRPGTRVQVRFATKR